MWCACAHHRRRRWRAQAHSHRGSSGSARPLISTISCKDIKLVSRIFRTQMPSVKKYFLCEYASMRHCNLVNGQLFAYVFGLDSGPDNRGAMRRLTSQVAGLPFVFVLVIWCFLHQMHLIVKSVLDILENWEWPSPHTLHTTFFSGVKVFANTWRSHGQPTRIYETACTCCGTAVAEQHFRKIPGAPMHARWGAVDSVEKVISNALLWISLFL